MDPTIQQTRTKTTNPAKIVRNGRSWPASVALVSDFSWKESLPEGFEFDENTVNNLCLACNLTVLLLLNLKYMVLDKKVSSVSAVTLQLLNHRNPHS